MPKDVDTYNYSTLKVKIRQFQVEMFTWTT